LCISEGWVLIAFQNAFRHLAIGTPIEDALIETVSKGGDTDTNAAICGALLGAVQSRGLHATGQTTYLC
jgi:ADP-ribosylglycohydrolase